MILIISGTNRPGANALKISQILRGYYASSGLDAGIYSLSEMPVEIFDPASYAKKPEPWLKVQQRVLDAHGLHVVTPEYNGSFPGVLKYFIDMLKFPESFEQKPVAFTGEAAGTWGALRAVEQLQHIFSYRNAHIYPDRVFIPGINGKLNDSGQITDPAIEDRLKAQTTGFGKFIQRLRA
ncbi:MAG: NAD(P)H-dependent oxidoreductase [Phycisphaerae bacterium]|jgi:NAD(P)H-dependent FMN reductase|nr:MAG: NAD(P)H-dependent oxidoreductase [Phycisphaerae bacterium]